MVTVQIALTESTKWDPIHKEVALIAQAALQDFFALDVECHRGRLLVLVWHVLQASSKRQQVPGILCVHNVLYAQQTLLMIYQTHVVKHHQALVYVIKVITETAPTTHVNHVN